MHAPKTSLFNGFIIVVLLTPWLYTPPTAASTGLAGPAAKPALATTSAWTYTSSLNTGRYISAALTWGNYIYALGGEISVGTDPLDSIERATINGDGTLNAWTTLTSTLPAGITRFGAAVAGDYMYVIGGYTAAGITNTVAYAPIYPDGAVGDWQTTAPLPSARYALAAVSWNGYL